MGCDIHPVIEVRGTKWPGDKTWEAVAIPDRGRNYAFFGALAGVRYEPSNGPVAEPRGYPDPEAEENRFCDWNPKRESLHNFLSREHTPSWLTLEEMENYDAQWLEKMGSMGQWNRWLRTMRFYANLYEVSDRDVRVVFDFDS